MKRHKIEPFTQGCLDQKYAVMYNEICFFGDTYGNLNYIDIKTYEKRSISISRSGLYPLIIFKDLIIIRNDSLKKFQVFELKNIFNK